MGAIKGGLILVVLAASAVRHKASSSGVAVPLELPEPWLSSGRIANPAAMPANSQTAGGDSG
jgi:hypothetical protein